MTDWLYNGLIEWLAERVQGMLAGLVSFLTATFFTSPDVTVFPQVQLLVSRSIVVVNAVFVLAIITAGAIGMTHGTLQIRYQVKDLLPRLVFAFVAANFGIELCRMLIEAANALTVAMAGETASGPQVVEYVKARMVAAAGDPAAAVLAVVIGLLCRALAQLNRPSMPRLPHRLATLPSYICLATRRLSVPSQRLVRNFSTSSRRP